MPLPDLTPAIVELIRRTSSSLPPDVKKALQEAKAAEAEGSTAQSLLQIMLENAALAETQSTPLCQDTGIPFFAVDLMPEWSKEALRRQIAAALVVATEKSYLRPNAVDSLTAANPGTNLGSGLPDIDFAEWPRAELRIRLLLKGGGSENVGSQYALPDRELLAGRDLEGVRRAVLHAVYKAQGQGCPPGILGVCIGGDRARGYLAAKKQLFRPLDEENPDPVLAALERRILEEANTLDIGPMGLGGKSTLLGVKIGTLARHPASYFVSVAYMCWECRRGVLTFNEAEGVRYTYA